MVLIPFLALFVAIAAAVGFAARRVTHSLAIGIVAGVAGLLAELYWALALFGEAVGEYDETPNQYVDTFRQFGWFGALLIHAVAPAAVLVAGRLAVRQASRARG